MLRIIIERDVIAQAQSGTGKTATFSISVLQRIDLEIKQCQALILAPTRELAQQIQKVVIAIGDFMKVDCHACIGGTVVREDMDALRNGVHIIVGTPGRVHDLIQRRALKTDHIKIFVLDEADEMLSVCLQVLTQSYEKLLTLFKSVALLSKYMIFSNSFPNQLRLCSCPPQCPRMFLRSLPNSCVTLCVS